MPVQIKWNDVCSWIYMYTIPSPEKISSLNKYVPCLPQNTTWSYFLFCPKIRTRSYFQGMSYLPTLGPLQPCLPALSWHLSHQCHHLWQEAVWCIVSLRAQAAALVQWALGHLPQAVALLCEWQHQCDEPCSILPWAVAPVQQVMWHPAVSAGTGAMCHVASGRKWPQAAAKVRQQYDMCRGRYALPLQKYFDIHYCP